MTAEKNISLHNRFDLYVKDASTGETLESAYAENVICDTLFSRLFYYDTNYSQYFDTIVVGTGTGVPSVTDETLFQYAGTLTSSETWKSPGVTKWLEKNRFSFTKTYTIDRNTLNGVKLTEIGIGTEYAICTHAMLMYNDGTEAVIEKTPDVEVTIAATVFVEVLNAPYDNGKISIPGCEYKVADITGSETPSELIVWAAGLEYFPNVLGARDFVETNKQTLSGDDIVWPTYDVADRSATIKRTFYNSDMWYNSLSSTRIVLYSLSSNSPAVVFTVGGGWFGGVTDCTRIAERFSDTEFTTFVPFMQNASVYVDGELQTSGVSVSSGIDCTNIEDVHIGMYIISGESTKENIVYTGDALEKWRETIGDEKLPVLYFGYGIHSKLSFDVGQTFYLYNPISEDLPVSRIVDSVNASVTSTNHYAVGYSYDMENFQHVPDSSNLSDEAKKAPFWKIEKRHSGDIYFVCDTSKWSIYEPGISYPKGNIKFDHPVDPNSVVSVRFDSPSIVLDNTSRFEFTAKIKLGTQEE